MGYKLYNDDYEISPKITQNLKFGTKPKIFDLNFFYISLIILRHYLAEPICDFKLNV